MKLIIDIPKATYDYWKEHKDEYVLSEAIANAIPYDDSGDLISRSALLNQIDTTDWSDVRLLVEDAPTVEPERPQGEWVEKEDTPASVYYCCSNCEMESIPVTPYCPWCGATMKDGAKE